MAGIQNEYTLILLLTISMIWTLYQGLEDFFSKGK